MVMSRNLCGHADMWSTLVAHGVGDGNVCVRFPSALFRSVLPYAKCLRSRPLSARITSDRIKSPAAFSFADARVTRYGTRPAGGKTIKEESGVEVSSRLPGPRTIRSLR